MPILNRLITWGLIGGALWLSLWHCQFGADLTDEAAYLLPGFKLYALGDRPFIDEIFAGPKNFGIANYFLLRPWLPFSVYSLRIASVLAYAVILLWLTRKAFRSRFGIIAGLTYFGCLTFDVFLLPTWSHNSWVRNLLLLQIGLLWSTEKTERRWPALFAGICAGAIAVIYQPLFVVTVLTAIGLAAWSAREKNRRFDPRSAAFPFRRYLLGAILPIAAYGLLLARWEIFGDWLRSFSATAALSTYVANHSFRKLADAALFVSRSRELWFVLVILPLAAILSGQKNSPRLVRIAAWAIAATSVAFFARRLAQTDTPFFMVTNAFVGLGLGSGLWYLARSPRNHTPGSIAVAGALVSAFFMSLSSMTGATALFWAMPALILPALGHRIQSLEFPKKWETRFGLAPLAALLIFIDANSTTNQWRRTYFDVAPARATSTLEVEPLRGLRTSPRRKELIERLAKAVEGKQFVLPYPTLPGLFYFGSLRSSRDTVFEIESFIPENLRDRSLEKIAAGRTPELFIVVKEHPWTWGIPREETTIDPAISLSPTDRYVRFIECAKERKLEDYPEYTLYSVAAERVGNCVQESNRRILIGRG